MSESVDLERFDVGYYSEPDCRVFTRAEVLARRDALLASCRLSRGDLYERAQAWTLTQDERNVYETLRTYDWLLGDDAVS